MPLLHASTLIDFVQRIFVAAGAPDDIAQIVATSLVNSDLVGHDSHGSVRVRQYLDAIRRGDLKPASRPSIVHEHGAAVTIDAQHGFGQVAAHFAIMEGVRRAKEHGIAAAGLIHSGHVGRLGEWVELAAEHDTLALAFCNGGGPSGAVAPFGGAERVLGTNPIAAALPVGESKPIILDFATSAVAEGKVRVARNRGKSIPEGWVLNKDGLPTTNPADLYDGGMLLPAATHKGYALSLLVEFMAGLLTGGGTPVLPGFTPGNCVLFIVLDIAAFRTPADYHRESNLVAARVKRTKPAPGFSQVLLPGEPEQQVAAARSAEGIHVDDATWALLTEDAAALNVPVAVGSSPPDSALNVVNAWHTALNSGSVAEMVALVHPQVEIGGPRGSARGTQVLREWFGRANVRLVPQRWFVQGNQVVVAQMGEWLTPGDNETPSRQTVATLFAVDGNGKITRIVRHETLPAALEDACMELEDETTP